MDDRRTRDHIKQHADAVLRGDTDAAASDFIEELRPHLPQIASALPRPVTGFEILSLEVGDTESVAMIRYSGDSGDVTMRSRWQNQSGRPMIVAAGPAE